MPRSGRAVHLDLAPGRPTGSGDINRSHTRVDELFRGFSREPPADFLGYDRNPQSATYFFHLAQKAGKIAIPFRLHGLLKRVEMQYQGVCIDHVNGSPALGQSVAVV